MDTNINTTTKDSITPPPSQVKKSKVIKSPKHKCILSKFTILYSRPKGNGLHILSVTDWSNFAKLIFDNDKKQLLANPYGLTLSATEAETISKWLDS